jgi:chitinase domain-containing protein 1
VPPALERQIAFNRADFLALQDFVDGFVFMTYDYSGGNQVGPNAPIQWFQDNLESLLPKGR